MTLEGASIPREVSGLQSYERAAIKTFLQGAVYCWCKNRLGEWFSLRDLMGGENFYWDGTPLIALYRMHAEEPDAVKRAGQDAGWLLKAVLFEDPRPFEDREGARIREYRWAADDV